MYKKMMIKGTIGLLPVLLMNTASAALMDFNFANLGVSGGSVNETVSMTSDGISVTVQAYQISNDGYGNISSSSLISGNGSGIYVSSTSSGNLGVMTDPRDETHSMDGGSSASDPDEGLLFTFNQQVSLDYINFDYFGSSDDFNLTVDGLSILTDFNGNDSSPLVSNVAGQFDEYNFNNISGSQILIWADGNSDSFRIDRFEVSAVPVPAAVWLFASGLLALTGLARRQS